LAKIEEKIIRQNNMDDKRRHGRFKMYQMIQLSIGKEKFIACEGINISKSGMLCKTNAEVHSSARFYLMFEVPLKTGKYEIKCEGLAAHVNPVEDGFEVGVSFCDLWEEDAKILEMYIAELAEEDN